MSLSKSSGITAGLRESGGCKKKRGRLLRERASACVLLCPSMWEEKKPEIVVRSKED